jgi:hypothetical protein
LAWLQEAFSLDSETGELRWRARPAGHFASAQAHLAWNKKYAGKIAGHPNKGYMRVRMFGRQFGAHRVVHALHYCQELSGELFVDHIDGNSMNNRPTNLRLVTLRENNRNRNRLNANNKSGVSGVFWHTQKQKWRAELKLKEGAVFLGAFDNLEDAKRAMEAGRKDLYARTSAHG